MLSEGKFGPASHCFMLFPPFSVAHIALNRASVVFELNCAFGVVASKEVSRSRDTERLHEGVAIE